MQNRQILVGLLCAINMICYADRTNIGIVIASFVKRDEDRGLVLSSFFYGYICTQILASWGATKIGGKYVLILGVCLWTICDISTIFAAHSSLFILMLVRAIMGMGEGVMFPTLHGFAADWFPQQERSLLVSIIASGSDLGTMLSLVISPSIMEHISWQAVFLVFGLFSLIWLVIFATVASNTPETSSSISSTERHYILCHRSSSTRKSPNVAYLELLRHTSLWAIYASHAAFNYGWYVLLCWIPQYLSNELHMKLSDHPFLAAMPYAFGFIGLLSSGYLSDVVINKGICTRLQTRRMMNSIGLFGPAGFLYLLRYATTSHTALALLSLALFTGRMSTSGYWVNMIDVGGDKAGQVMGTSNTIATLPGIFGNLITGYILQETKSWNTVFEVTSIVMGVGGIIFLLGSSDKPIGFMNKKGTMFKRTTSLEDPNDESSPFLNR